MTAIQLLSKIMGAPELAFEFSATPRFPTPYPHTRWYMRYDCGGGRMVKIPANDCDHLPAAADPETLARAELAGHLRAHRLIDGPVSRRMADEIEAFLGARPVEAP